MIFSFISQLQLTSTRGGTQYSNKYKQNFSSPTKFYPRYFTKLIFQFWYAISLIRIFQVLQKFDCNIKFFIINIFIFFGKKFASNNILGSLAEITVNYNS